MNKKLVFIGIIATFMLFAYPSSAQDPAKPSNYRVAIFTPLYLDSAFDENFSYRFGRNFPKYINSGLEFYEGAQMAIDSMEKEGLSMQVQVFDTRSANGSVAKIIKTKQIDSFDLIIGHVNAGETKLLANAVAGKNIPFINVNYPNDAGVSNNPSFIILNTTLLTHCAAMYKFIQTKHALSPVVVFRKKGSQEDKLKQYFDNISKNTASVPLKIKYVTLENTFTPDDLKKHLDKDATTVVIAGSLDLNFGSALTQQLATLYNDHPSVVFGMPTWWEATDFSGSAYKNIEVIYTTPFYISPENQLAEHVENEFKEKYYSRPTEMVFRGYETMYHFAHLLLLNGKNLGSSLSDRRFKVFNDFDIQPVLDARSNTLNYFENKKIHFVKKVEGDVIDVY